LKKLALLAMFVVMGLAFAWLPGPEYAEDQYHKASCIYQNSESMAVFIDDNFGACNGECPGAALIEEMSTSMTNLGMYKGTDLTAFGQEYVYFLSLFNELRFDYLYYGIAYVLDGGGEDFPDMAELMDEFGDYNSQVLSCFAGGSQVT